MNINAFSPLYVKTYMPQFMASIRKEADQKANGVKYGAKSRATRQNVVDAEKSAISNFPKTKRVSLAPTEFYMYSRAGAPKK